MDKDKKSMEKYIWYILKYHKDFSGILSDEECMRKISYETGGVNMLDFRMCQDALKEYSKQDIDVVLMDLEQRGWM